MEVAIPKEDLQIINRILNPSSEIQSISMRVNGKVSEVKKEFHSRGYIIQDFRGRIVKHQISVIPKDGSQIIVANAGDKYDEIPVDKRKMVIWSESDFQ